MHEVLDQSLPERNQLLKLVDPARTRSSHLLNPNSTELDLSESSESKVQTVFVCLKAYLDLQRNFHVGLAILSLRYLYNLNNVG